MTLPSMSCHGAFIFSRDAEQLCARRRSTYEPLSRWLADARALASPDLAVVVVGNKLDKADDEREVSILEATQWASENGEQ